MPTNWAAPAKAYDALNGKGQFSLFSPLLHFPIPPSFHYFEVKLKQQNEENESGIITKSSAALLQHFV